MENSLGSGTRRCPVALIRTAACILALSSVAASANAEQVLHLFCSKKHCLDGETPVGGLVMDQSGNLFGTALYGGTNTYGGRGVYSGGTVFEYKPSTGNYSVIYNFCSLTKCTDGKNPYSVKLVVDTAGNLYGTTHSGGYGSGVVFELVGKKSGWQEKVLLAFCPNAKRGCSGGGAPLDGLTYAGAASGQYYDGTSPLYGTASNAIFSITPGGKHPKEKVIYNVCNQQNCPGSGTPLYIDGEGNIYGTTTNGGQSNDGTVFELSPNGSGYTETTLYNFCAQANCADGEEPYGGVIMDSTGNLIGTASDGGSERHGVIFELSPNGTQWQYSVLADFDGKNGSFPESNLTLDANGNLFGTALQGGANPRGGRKGGTVFEFDGSIETLYIFCAQPVCMDGSNPIAGVIEDSAGNLYGTTAYGGHHQDGVVFELSP
jgi:uncharacterized repeat protein (TIGR03803 family)